MAEMAVISCTRGTCGYVETLLSTHIEESVALRQLYSCVFAVAWVCGCEFIYAFINQLTKCKFCIFHTRKKLNEMCEGGCVSEPARV